MCNNQEKGGENKSKKKWKLWRASSEGSTVKKGGETAVPDSSFTYAVAVMVPKDFKLIKQEWAAIRIQAVFRAFLVTFTLMDALTYNLSLLVMF